MSSKKTLLAGAIALLSLAACRTTGDGGLIMGVDVEGLTAAQHFCVSWRLYQEPIGGGERWALIDERADTLCAGLGANEVSDFATCYDGRRYLVEYVVAIYDGEDMIGTAVATSGGGPEDLCIKNTDVDTRALIQFREEGNAGGVNPGIGIDMVCSNDKVELENGKLVSALWLQPDTCTGDEPDGFCVLASGEGLETVRTGVTLDGLTRYIFSTAELGAAWDAYYLAFNPNLAAGELHVYNAAYVLHHYAMADVYGREELEEVAGAYLFRTLTGAAKAGFIHVAYTPEGPMIRVIHDETAACNAPLARDAVIESFPAPGCDPGFAALRGLIELGPTTFGIVFECGLGDLRTVACNPVALMDGRVCAAQIQ